MHHGTAAERHTAWQVCSGWLHATSRKPLILPPLVVLDSGQVVHPYQLQPTDWARAALIRFSLDDYRYSAATWDRLGEQDPYFHALVTEQLPASHRRNGYTWTGSQWVRDADYKSKKTLASAPWLAETPADAQAIVALHALTGGCQTPILRADNWLWQVAVSENRNVGYYELLGIKTQDDYERAIGFDPKANVDPGFLQLVLGAVHKDRTGVAEQHRRVEIRKKIAGEYWLTKDAKLALDNKNPLRQLNGGLDFDASETFGHLANGFWAVGVFDKQRKRLDAAPVGFDKGTHNNNGRILNGLSCFHCHSEGGLHDFREYFRGLKRPLQTPVKEKVEVIEGYALPLDQFFRDGRRRYADALWQATALKPEQFADRLRRYFAAYETNLDLPRVALDLGTTPAHLRASLEAKLKRTGYLDTVFADLLEPGGTLAVEDLIDSATQLQLDVRGLDNWPTYMRVVK